MVPVRALLAFLFTGNAAYFPMAYPILQFFNHLFQRRTLERLVLSKQANQRRQQEPKLKYLLVQRLDLSVSGSDSFNNFPSSVFGRRRTLIRPGRNRFDKWKSINVRRGLKKSLYPRDVERHQEVSKRSRPGGTP